MAITVKLYRFEKKENSTAKPDDRYATVFNCKLKEPCGILRPEIILDLGATENPARTNYAFIQDFDRYYFIDEWTYDRGLWIARMHVDVLATYKTVIGASSHYILRAADSTVWNGDVIDNYYPALADMAITEKLVSASNPLFNGGCYILGIYGNDGYSIATGPITWYHFTAANMTKFTKWLYSDDMYDLTGGAVDKAIFDPLQYIATAFWLPFNVPYSGTGLSVRLGWYDSPIGTGDDPPFTASRLSTPEFGPFSTTIEIPKHPQAATRGNFLNTAPYSRYTLYAGPFGVIPLDSADLLGLSSLTLEITRLDITTGTCRFQVKTGLKTLYHAVEQVAVPMPLAQLSQSILGYGVRQAVGGVEALANYFGGGTVADAVSSVKDTAIGAVAQIAKAIPGIGSCAGSVMPQISVSGSVGTRVNIYNPFLSGHFLSVADANDDHAGRPVCGEHVINTLSGFILCADGELEAAATTPELDDISAYLTGGFFYE